MRYEPLETLADLIKDTRESKLKPAEDIPPALLELPYEQLRPAVALPAPVPSDKELEETLLKREALRYWEDGPIRLQHLASVLSVVIEGDRQDWQVDNQNGNKLELFLYARNVEGLEPAIYHYVHEDRILIPMGKVADREADSVVLQKEFLDAPAILIIGGKLGASLCERGSAGHQRLLVRAGLAGNRAWLSSIGYGYGGSIFAGILARQLYELAGMDGYQVAQLFAYAFGVPLELAKDTSI